MIGFFIMMTSWPVRAATIELRCTYPSNEAVWVCMQWLIDERLYVCVLMHARIFWHVNAKHNTAPLSFCKRIWQCDLSPTAVRRRIRCHRAWWLLHPPRRCARPPQASRRRRHVQTPLNTRHRDDWWWTDRWLSYSHTQRVLITIQL